MSVVQTIVGEDFRIYLPKDIRVIAGIEKDDIIHIHAELNNIIIRKKTLEELITCSLCGQKALGKKIITEAVCFRCAVK